METQRDNRVRNPDPSIGRDDLNLVEFPIFCVTSATDYPSKTITFQRKFKNKLTNSPDICTWKIVSSEEYGLPDVAAGDVYIALNALHARSANPSSAYVQFSQYELLRMMGWPTSTTYYERLKRAILTLAGTHYSMDKWWNPEVGQYVARGFNMISEWQLIQSKKVAGQEELPLSFVEFTAGYMRALQGGWTVRTDPRLYFSVSSPVAKQGIRFFDKRLRPGRRDQFSLYEVATTHLGIKADDAKGKRLKPSVIQKRLRRPIQQLVEIGFLEDEPENTRYQQSPKGEHLVYFAKAQPQDKGDPNIDALIAAGVTPAVAEKLVKDHAHSSAAIAEKIEWVEWLSEQGGKKAPQDAAAFLVKAIRDNYALTPGFLTKAQRDALAHRKKQQQDAVSKKRQAEEDEAAIKLQAERQEAARRWREVETHLLSLLPAERTAFEKEAIAATEAFCHRFIRQYLAEGKPEKSIGHGFYQDAMIRHYEAAETVAI